MIHDNRGNALNNLYIDNKSSMDKKLISTRLGLAKKDSLASLSSGKMSPIKGLMVSCWNQLESHILPRTYLCSSDFYHSCGSSLTTPALSDKPALPYLH